MPTSNMALPRVILASALVVLSSVTLVHCQLFFNQSVYSVVEDIPLIDGSSISNTVNVCYGYAFELDNLPVIALISTVEGTATGK